jgi:hypothetical protein
MGAGNDVYGNQLANAGSGSSAGIGSSLNGANVAADHNGHQTAAYVYLADQVNVSSLNHSVGSFDRTDETFGFNHAQSLQSSHNTYLHEMNLLFGCDVGIIFQAAQ